MEQHVGKLCIAFMVLFLCSAGLALCVTVKNPDQSMQMVAHDIYTTNVSGIDETHTVLCSVDDIPKCIDVVDKRTSAPYQLDKVYPMIVQMTQIDSGLHAIKNTLVVTMVFSFICTALFGMRHLRWI